MPLPSRWLQDDAIALQLQEVRAIPSMLSDDQERRWFVALCLFRADKAIKARLQHELAATKRLTPFYTWFVSLMFGIEDDPAAYPFSLSEREFAYYATTTFGGKMGDIEGIYHPPNFYKALAGDTVGIVLGAAAGAALPFLIPEAAGATALSLPGLATASGRSASGAAIGSGVSHLIPGGSWDAARKSTLWPRYQLDYKRRSLK